MKAMGLPKILAMVALVLVILSVLGVALGPISLLHIAVALLALAFLL